MCCESDVHTVFLYQCQTGVGVSLQSVGLHDEMNWILAIVGLCSLSEGNYLGYTAVNEWNYWHKACDTPVR